MTWFGSVTFVLVEQFGVLATLSRWRSWVQIPSRGLVWRGTQLAKRQSSNLCDFVGSTPTRATAITTIARTAFVRKIFVIANENASAGHWRAQVAVTHPPSRHWRFNSVPTHSNNDGPFF